MQLFMRAPRKLHLTPADLRLLKEARKVLIRVERARRAVRETNARFRAPLRIGVADGIAQPKLTECIVRWHEVAPEIPLELTEMRACELADALLREELDAGFYFGVPDDAAVALQPAWSYPAVALLPLGHVGIGDAGHVATLCRDEVGAVPIKEDERITKFVLHKQQRFGMPEPLQRSLLKPKLCSEGYSYCVGEAPR